MGTQAYGVWHRLRPRPERREVATSPWTRLHLTCPGRDRIRSAGLREEPGWVKNRFKNKHQKIKWRMTGRSSFRYDPEVFLKSKIADIYEYVVIDIYMERTILVFKLHPLTLVIEIFVDVHGHPVIDSFIFFVNEFFQLVNFHRFEFEHLFLYFVDIKIWFDEYGAHSHPPEEEPVPRDAGDFDFGFRAHLVPLMIDPLLVVDICALEGALVAPRPDRGGWMAWFD
jgi:hypothetical protein